MDLSLDRWDGVSMSERELLAERLAKDLPAGFAFHALRQFRLGESHHNIALYQFRDAAFALVPGGAISLGFDVERAWEPSARELESWRGTAVAYGINKSLQEHVASATLRPRWVKLAPFLVETTAVELGWEPVGLDDPEVLGIIAEYGKERQVEVCRGGASTRIRQRADGSVVAERSLSRTHSDLAEQLKATGFRFPTSDEWEYACGCGEPTLFRWGDHAPCDRYPTDVSPEEAAWRRQWVLSGGELERPPDGFKSDWDYHRSPNSFGVFIASDPYKYELVAEVGTTRGGDGGCMICGGTGFFLGWLTLATAYFDEDTCKHDRTEAISPGYTVGRRVLGLQ